MTSGADMICARKHGSRLGGRPARDGPVSGQSSSWQPPGGRALAVAPATPRARAAPASAPGRRAGHRTAKSRNCDTWPGVKLLSLTISSDLRPSASLGPNVMPSKLSSASPSVVRSRTSVLVTDSTSAPIRLSSPETSSAPGRPTRCSATELPTPTENERSIASRNWLFSGSSSTRPLTLKALGGTGSAATESTG